MFNRNLSNGDLSDGDLYEYEIRQIKAMTIGRVIDNLYDSNFWLLSCDCIIDLNVTNTPTHKYDYTDFKISEEKIPVNLLTKNVIDKLLGRHYDCVTMDYEIECKKLFLSKPKLQKLYGNLHPQEFPPFEDSWHSTPYVDGIYHSFPFQAIIRYHNDMSSNSKCLCVIM